MVLFVKGHLEHFGPAQNQVSWKSVHAALAPALNLRMVFPSPENPSAGEGQ